MKEDYLQTLQTELYYQGSMPEREIWVDVRGLLPKMIRGVVGCEQGCPANAKELVEQGFRNFSLAYVEGGILTAAAVTTDGHLTLKLFPEF